MKVIIVHYHLNPGGVTRIIEAQIKGIRSVSEDLDIALLCGDDNGVSILHGVSVLSDNSLYYMNAGMAEMNYAKSVADIILFMKKNITGQPILHFHNPNLGKSPALTMAAFKLASEGYPVINHCHDFPEDRPANLALLESVIPGLSQLSLSQVMYPDFPRYHFLVLNSCDYDRILFNGVPASRVHLLPNPVSMGKQNINNDKQSLRRKICMVLDFDSSKKICTYPVRAIGRKNLGEFILLASLFTDIVQFAITQPPRNPAELPRYNRWKTFCRENSLAVKFEAGEAVNHEELINISDFCITTSIREGFGMVYLEPWLAGTPVIGRELTCIIGDLKKQGVEFPRLYSSILVETAEESVDFKDLGQDAQEQIIKEVISHNEYKLKLTRNNPFLNTLFDDFPREIILRNQQVIMKSYSIEEYGKELFAIYKEISR